MAPPPMPLVAYGAGNLLAFAASTITSAAFLAGTPNVAAAAPDRNVTTPIFTVFSWATAGDPDSKTAT